MSFPPQDTPKDSSAQATQTLIFAWREHFVIIQIAFPCFFIPGTMTPAATWSPEVCAHSGAQFSSLPDHHEG